MIPQGCWVTGLCQAKGAGVFYADFEREWGRRLEPPWRESSRERLALSGAQGLAQAVRGRAGKSWAALSHTGDVSQ